MSVILVMVTVIKKEQLLIATAKSGKEVIFKYSSWFYEKLTCWMITVITYIAVTVCFFNHLITTMYTSFAW